MGVKVADKDEKPELPGSDWDGIPKMNVQEQIEEYITSQTEPKR